MGQSFYAGADTNDWSCILRACHDMPRANAENRGFSLEQGS